jgi:hypothetical protein
MKLFGVVNGIQDFKRLKEMRLLHNGLISFFNIPITFLQPYHSRKSDLHLMFIKKADSTIVIYVILIYY